MLALRIMRKVVTITAMVMVFFLLLTVIKMEATPIQPNVREILSRPSVPANEFAPARAGWNGPETPKAAQAVNLTYEQFGPQATAQKVHGALAAAFIPDYRVLAGLMLIVMLLRRIKVSQRKAAVAVVANQPASTTERAA